ncbi:HWE histidine kinase domain-containing protein [Lacibacterium aquatile]|uniref:histidine kinase n=1 Tax=Lacibacterium aquatile TaxID=1168082 RepID=A0ABW5DNL4_9PROT
MRDAVANSSLPHHSGAPIDFLLEGGEMGARMRAYDWSNSPLGPAWLWPQSLKTTVSIMLRTPVAIVLLWGPDGIMLYNDAYSIFAAGRHPHLLGSKVLEGWPEVADFNANVMRVGMAGGTLSYQDQELTLHRNGKPEPVFMNLDYSPVLDESGKPGGVLAIVVETTERIQAERRIADEGERLRAMFKQAPGFIAVLRGPDHVLEIVNDSHQQLIGHRHDIIGRPARESMPELNGQGFFKLMDKVYESGIPYVGRSMPILLQRTPDAPAERRFIDVVYQPTYDETGQISGIFAEGYDVTTRVEGEERQKLLIRELNHRVKNLFAITSGIVALTARSAASPQEMAQTLLERLDALARANNLIRPLLDGEETAEASSLDLLLEAVLRPYLNARPDRVVFDGPAVGIGAGAVTSLSLALHELATNAAKYGALSTEHGQIRISWDLADEKLNLRWQEIGGPKIESSPATQGFGSLLSKQSISGQLRGSIGYDWKPDGLMVTVAVPLERLR